MRFAAVSATNRAFVPASATAWAGLDPVDLAPCAHFVAPDQNALSENRAQVPARAAQTQLPMAPSTQDLFRDNVLFDGDALSGLIDFGFAATDEFAYDLAITTE